MYFEKQLFMVLAFIQSGGWLMVPIISCSILAVGIILESLLTLRHPKVIPPGLVTQVWQWHQEGNINSDTIAILAMIRH